MIQINLLPDVKQEYLRARRTRNVAISVSILAGIGSVAVVVLLLVVLGVQAGREALADNSIDNKYAELQEVEDLSELVTLQNQLQLIGDQHTNKTMDSRVFNVLQAINPTGDNTVQYTAVTLDPETKTLGIEGVAENGYRAVESLKKTIENTDLEYRLDDQSEEAPLAEQVTIGETNFGENSDGQRVLRFEVMVSYNELLFSNTVDSLRVAAPNRRIDVTDSKIGVPDSLFTTPVTEEEN